MKGSVRRGPDPARQERLMRQLAILPNADAAQAFADYLQTLQIETRLDKLPDRCAVWVFDEDRLTQARKELADFTNNPADPRFAAARQAAAALAAVKKRTTRRKTPSAPRGPARRRRREQAPWTYGLIAACVIVFVAHTGYLIVENGGFGSPAAMDVLFSWQPKELDVKISPAQTALSIASIDLVDRDHYHSARLVWTSNTARCGASSRRSFCTSA